MLIAILIVSGTGLQAQTKRPESGTVIESFLAPDAHAKPMARMWFPDASAGEDDNDYIEKQISELAAKGFGGVEVAMPSIMLHSLRPPCIKMSQMAPTTIICTTTPFPTTPV